MRSVSVIIFNLGELWNWAKLFIPCDVIWWGCRGNGAVRVSGVSEINVHLIIWIIAMPETWMLFTANVLFRFHTFWSIFWGSIKAWKTSFLARLGVEQKLPRSFRQLHHHFRNKTSSGIGWIIIILEFGSLQERGHTRPCCWLFLGLFRPISENYHSLFLVTTETRHVERGDFDSVPYTEVANGKSFSIYEERISYRPPSELDQVRPQRALKLDKICTLRIIYSECNGFDKLSMRLDVPN